MERLPDISRLIFAISAFTIICANPITVSIDNPNSLTKVTTKNVTRPKIDVKILGKPHHLFIGRCSPKDEILHEEHIVLTNDGKSHVSANIRMNIEGPVNITCVNVYDEMPNGEGGYPSFAAGGVGHDFVEFNVMTNYGKGFHFYTRVQGYTKKDIV
ncbi:unnamed protein product [Phyllotreta striolata]|uniref:Uncharacterized protein n=1 Tax=Phyllotreta striolata TaxID=444603 RepID=A0A9N9TG82_PHYSR|nr:unnamed protein product [Phyllotreta striolata]